MRYPVLPLCLFTLLLAACGETGNPGLRLNEVCGKDSTTGDWIEIYNASSTPFRLGGHYLLKTDEDGIDHILHTFPDTVLDPGSCYVVTRLGGSLERKISRTKEVGVELVAPNDKTVDSFYRDDDVGDSPHPVGGSYARVPDGTGPWIIADRSTPGKPNS